MAPPMKIIFGLLTLVTVGMIIGALSQLAFIRKLEDSYDTDSRPFRRLRELGSNGYIQLPRGLNFWNNDEEAKILRLGYIKPEVLSWSPRIILLHNFLSIEECDYLRAIALPRLKNSTVVDKATGKSIKSGVRTSNGMFLSRKERKYPMVEFNLKRGGQRIATMLMYLTDNVDGGETYFPTAGSGHCSCGGEIVQGLCVKPTKGNAVLFWSMGLDGQSDPNSLHGSCEVLSGEKWSATKWMRQAFHT
ncbi:unnamed protein product [Lupinus luteus]|uniref:Prolyl 4-hydroxylase alpha subunit domain-containing protein n=1 Tax=Lupinus luteus TaxID=3873 RepID=A0AAV1X3J7_LUPLU